MRFSKLAITSCLFSLLICMIPLPTQAASGIPGALEFGYGAYLNLNGPQLEAAYQIAPAIGLDWIAIQLDWAANWKNPDQEPDLSRLDVAMQSTCQKQLQVMLSLTNAPPWAMTTHGPHPDLTAYLVEQLARRYPCALLAVDLFPGANTNAGWGSIPDPRAYIQLYQTVQGRLINLGSPIIPLVSLIPLGQTTIVANNPQDIDDLMFLEELYKAQPSVNIPVIGIYFTHLNNSLMTDPNTTTLPTLRHYEAVRQIMLKHDRKNNLIWITRFAWPAELSTSEEQAAWTYQAFKLLKAQLYLGAAFLSQINPPGDSPNFPVATTSHQDSLISKDGQLHPAAQFIKQVARLANPTMFIKRQERQLLEKK